MRIVLQLNYYVRSEAAALLLLLSFLLFSFIALFNLYYFALYGKHQQKKFYKENLSYRYLPMWLQRNGNS
jgi:hypothetical protein